MGEEKEQGTSSSRQWGDIAGYLSLTKFTKAHFTHMKTFYFHCTV